MYLCIIWRHTKRDVINQRFLCVCVCCLQANCDMSFHSMHRPSINVRMAALTYMLLMNVHAIISLRILSKTVGHCSTDSTICWANSRKQVMTVRIHAPHLQIITINACRKMNKNLTCIISFFFFYFVFFFFSVCSVTGLLNLWYNQVENAFVMNHSIANRYEAPRIQAFTFHDMQTSFLILAIGLLVCILVFVIEMCIVPPRKAVFDYCTVRICHYSYNVNKHRYEHPFNKPSTINNK